jgi:hypothetical protein
VCDLQLNTTKDTKMLNKIIKTTLAGSLLFVAGHAMADVVSSEQVLASQQFNYNKQQVMSFVNDAAVQNKLVALGVTPAVAQQRIANMTNDELIALNTQLNDMPAGGIVDTVVTVLVVVAVLDLMGLTDVYPFINPIRG